MRMITSSLLFNTLGHRRIPAHVIVPEVTADYWCINVDHAFGILWDNIAEVLVDLIDLHKVVVIDVYDRVLLTWFRVVFVFCLSRIISKVLNLSIA